MSQSPLRKCLDCEKEISSNAKYCPNCGAPTPNNTTANTFRNPANGYSETISTLTPLWAFLFGPFYWAIKGAWKHVGIIVLFVLAMVPLHGLGIFFNFVLISVVYPIVGKSILRRQYLRKGWLPVA